jgi:SAM-dependent methyltransferase
MDYKAENRRTYDTYTDAFEEKFERHFRQYVVPRADQFIAELKGPRVLDLGSGPGNHAAYFASKGKDVLCADLSERMVEKCRSKGLHAEVQDIEHLTLPSGSFDGIWAQASLLHVPKANVPSVVSKLNDLLTSGGVLAISVKEGTGEQWELNEKYPGTQRWFSYFTEEEIRGLFSEKFEVLDSVRSSIKSGEYYFLFFLFRKRG